MNPGGVSTIQSLCNIQSACLSRPVRMPLRAGQRTSTRACASGSSGGGGSSSSGSSVGSKWWWWCQRRLRRRGLVAGWRAAEAVAAHSATRECPRGTTRPPHQHPRHMQRARCVLRGACCVLPCCACVRAPSLRRTSLQLAAPGAGAGNSPGVNEIDETQPPDWQPYPRSQTALRTTTSPREMQKRENTRTGEETAVSQSGASVTF